MWVMSTHPHATPVGTLLATYRLFHQLDEVHFDPILWPAREASDNYFHRPLGTTPPIPANVPQVMGSLIKKRRKRMRKKKHKKMLKATRWQRRAAGK
jgi:hypothetical protein